MYTLPYIYICRRNTSKKKSIIVYDLLKENYIKFTKIAGGGFGDVYKEIRIISYYLQYYYQNVPSPNILPVIYALSIKDQVYMIAKVFISLECFEHK